MEQSGPQASASHKHRPFWHTPFWEQKLNCSHPSPKLHISGRNSPSSSSLSSWWPQSILFLDCEVGCDGFFVSVGDDDDANDGFVVVPVVGDDDDGDGDDGFVVSVGDDDDADDGLVVSVGDDDDGDDDADDDDGFVVSVGDDGDGDDGFVVSVGDDDDEDEGFVVVFVVGDDVVGEVVVGSVGREGFEGDLVGCAVGCIVLRLFGTRTRRFLVTAGGLSCTMLSTIDVAAQLSIVVIFATDEVGCPSSSCATTPETYGHAILVPDRFLYWLSSPRHIELPQADIISTPGA